MKGKRQNFIKIIAIIIVLPAICFGQAKLAQTGLQFLEIGVSPRAEAMGGAFVLAGNNADALFYNPAGISKVNSTYDVVLNRVQWFADINYNAVGVTFKPEGEYGVFGLSFLNADYGDFYGTRVSAGSVAGYEDTGTFSPTAMAIGLSYGKQLSDKFSIGGQVKYVRQSLGSNILFVGDNQKENTVSGFAFDFGMMYATGIQGFDFGMSIKNFATDFKYEQYGFEAPLTFRVGLSLKVFELLGLANANQDFLVVADAVHPRDYGEHLDLGAEYSLYKMVSFRLGYKVNYSEQSFTAGLGVNYNLTPVMNMRVNYSYGSFGIWDGVHRFSLGFSI
jgi:long-subunit fatty acid transport protein